MVCCRSLLIALVETRKNRKTLTVQILRITWLEMNLVRPI